jgi:hypothetical protein
MRFRSKPSEIEAIQWDGAAKTFTAMLAAEMPVHAGGEQWQDGALLLLCGKDGAQEYVPVPAGHWIVRQPGDLSDHWPVDPDYFASKYEPAE